MLLLCLHEKQNHTSICYGLRQSRFYEIAITSYFCARIYFCEARLN